MLGLKAILPLGPYCVRIVDEHDRTVGIATHVGGGHFATCAHVLKPGSTGDDTTIDDRWATAVDGPTNWREEIAESNCTVLSSPATGGYAGPPDLALFRLNLKQEDGAPLLSQLRLPYRDEVHQHHPLLVAIDPVSRLKTKMALSIEVEGFWLATSDLQTVPGQSGSPIVDPESGVLKMLVKGWGGQELVAQGVGRAAEMDALAILTSIDPLLEHLPEGLDPHRMNKSRATAVVISSSDAIQAIGLDDVRTAAITHVDTNPGTPLNIVGDAGSGKSTLLASILSEVSRSRSVVFTAADADDDMIAMIRKIAHDRGRRSFAQQDDLIDLANDLRQDSAVVFIDEFPASASGAVAALAAQGVPVVVALKGHDNLPGLASLAVPHLNADNARRLASRLLQAPLGDDPALSAFIATWSDGLPLMIEVAANLVRSAADPSADALSAASALLPHLRDHPSQQGRLGATLSAAHARLDPADQECLNRLRSCASGAWVPLAVLAEVCGDTAGHATRLAVVHLRNAGLLTATPDGKYVKVHGLIDSFLPAAPAAAAKDVAERLLHTAEARVGHPDVVAFSIDHLVAQAVVLGADHLEDALRSPGLSQALSSSRRYAVLGQLEMARGLMARDPRFAGASLLAAILLSVHGDRSAWANGQEYELGVELGFEYVHGLIQALPDAADRVRHFNALVDDLANHSRPFDHELALLIANMRQLSHDGQFTVLRQFIRRTHNEHVLTVLSEYSQTLFTSLRADQKLLLSATVAHRAATFSRSLLVDAVVAIEDAATQLVQGSVAGPTYHLVDPEGVGLLALRNPDLFELLFEILSDRLADEGHDSYFLDLERLCAWACAVPLNDAVERWEHLHFAGGGADPEEQAAAIRLALAARGHDGPRRSPISHEASPMGPGSGPISEESIEAWLAEATTNVSKRQAVERIASLLPLIYEFDVLWARRLARQLFAKFSLHQGRPSWLEQRAFLAVVAHINVPTNFDIPHRELEPDPSNDEEAGSRIAPGFVGEASRSLGQLAAVTAGLDPLSFDGLVAMVDGDSDRVAGFLVGIGGELERDTELLAKTGELDELGRAILSLRPVSGRTTGSDVLSAISSRSVDLLELGTTRTGLPRALLAWNGTYLLRAWGGAPAVDAALAASDRPLRHLVGQWIDRRSAWRSGWLRLVGDDLSPVEHAALLACLGDLAAVSEANDFSVALGATSGTFFPAVDSSGSLLRRFLTVPMRSDPSGEAPRQAIRAAAERLQIDHADDVTTSVYITFSQQLQAHERAMSWALECLTDDQLPLFELGVDHLRTVDAFTALYSELARNARPSQLRMRSILAERVIELAPGLPLEWFVPNILPISVYLGRDGHLPGLRRMMAATNDPTLGTIGEFVMAVVATDIGDETAATRATEAFRERSALARMIPDSDQRVGPRLFGLLDAGTPLVLGQLAEWMRGFTSPEELITCLGSARTYLRQVVDPRSLCRVVQLADAVLGP